MRNLLFVSFIFIGAIGSPSPTPSQPESSRESKIKAGYLFNFAKFVEWPASDPKSTTDTIVIGIIGADPLGDYLDEAVQGKDIEGKSVTVKRFEAVEEITACHILFISASHRGNADEILESMRETSTLLVGANEDLFERGCHLSFVIKENKVKFKVNKSAAERVGLKLSSKILRVADEVIG